MKRGNPTLVFVERVKPNIFNTTKLSELGTVFLRRRWIVEDYLRFGNRSKAVTSCFSHSAVEVEKVLRDCASNVPDDVPTGKESKRCQ